MRSRIILICVVTFPLLYTVGCYGPERYRPIVRSPELEQSKQQLEEVLEEQIRRILAERAAQSSTGGSAGGGEDFGQHD